MRNKLIERKSHQYIVKLFPVFPVSLLVCFLSSFTTQHKLIIEISDLKNDKGNILLEMLDADKNPVKGVSKSIESNKCTLTISNLKSGKYVFKYFHDENENKKIDTNLIGIPKEGFGFSNNAKGTFGPPSHEKMIFEIKGDTTVYCTPSYINKK